MQAEITNVNRAVLRTLSGDENEVCAGVVAFAGATWSSEPIDVNFSQISPELRQSIASGVRRRLQAIGSGCVDLHDTAFSHSSITIAAPLEPGWVMEDEVSGRLALCFWADDFTLHFRTMDAGFLHIQPYQLWASINFWNPDTGNQDDELGLFVRDVMFELHQNSQWFHLELTPAPDNRSISRRIAEFVSVVNDDEPIAALYMLGLPCDGTLDEDDFSVLARLSSTFDSMTNLVIDPPAACVDQVRELLTSRTTGGVRVVLEALNALSQLHHNEKNEIDWPAVLLRLRASDEG